MKVTESGKLNHRQLQNEGYPQKVSAEQREYAGACAPPKMTETDITNTNQQTEGLLRGCGRIQERATGEPPIAQS